MSIVRVTEANDSPELTSQTLTKTTMVRRFIVVTNSIYDGPYIAQYAAGVPQRGSSYSYGSDATQLFLWCVDKKAKRESIGPYCKWIIEASYETPDASTDQSQQETPLLELPEVSMSTSTKTVPMPGYYDDTGALKAWRNSAGQIIEKPPERDTTIVELTITVNRDIGFDTIGLAMEYCNTTNSDSFWGATDGTCRCKAITGKGARLKLPDDQFFEYQRVSYSFEFLNETGADGEIGWDFQQLDSGSYYIDDDGNHVTFKNKDAHPIKQGLLDGEGGKNADDAEPQWLPVVRRYERKAFLNLNLPQSFADCKCVTR